ncbi:MAG: NAD(P)/FAD-dependent oxidoreductase [Ktedonobacteraceae bacterium]
MEAHTTQGNTAQVTERTPASSEAEKSTGFIPRVVIIGAGFGGLQAAKSLAHLPVKVTLIDRNNHHLFQPMLYQVATAGLSPADIATPVRETLSKQENAAVLMATVHGVDVQEQRVLLGHEQRIPYDYLIVATGATSNYFGHDEWAKLAPGLKNVDEAMMVRDRVLLAFEAAERDPDEEKRKALMTFVLVGGGPTGVELAGSIAELAHKSFSRNFRHIRPSDARIILVEGKSRVMPSFPTSLTNKAQKQLQQLGVELRNGVHVENIDQHSVMIGKDHVDVETVIWTAGVKASPAGQWLQAAVDHDGRVKVQSDMTIPGHANIFVIGDTALAMQRGKPLPGLAPVALQEAKYVASVIEDKLQGKEHKGTFHYFNKGTMATVGRAFGVVDIGFIRFTGLMGWLAWLFVHILLLLGVQNRLVVFLRYTWSYITYQRAARVILPEHSSHPPI